MTPGWLLRMTDLGECQICFVLRTMLSNYTLFLVESFTFPLNNLDTWHWSQSWLIKYFVMFQVNVMAMLLLKQNRNCKLELPFKENHSSLFVLTAVDYEQNIFTLKECVMKM